MITTLKVKNGLVKFLPKELQKAWIGADVVLRVSSDTLVLKKMRPDSFWKTWKQMKPLAKDISQADIQAAISRSRKNRGK